MMKTNSFRIFVLILAMLLASQASVFADSVVQVNQNASVITNLVCTTNSNYNVQWIVNGIAQPQFQNQRTISHTFLKKGQVWTCQALSLTYDINGILITQLEGSATVTIKNVPPQIISIPVLTGTVSNTYTYDVKAIDADGDSLSYLLITTISGMSINSNTGVVSWVPNATGLYPVTVGVTDGTDTTTQPFTINVTQTSSSLSVNANANPSLGTAPLTVDFTSNVTGGVGPYNYSWDFFNNGTYELFIQNPTYTYTQNGTYTARVVVSDSAHHIASKTITIIVTPQQQQNSLNVTASANPSLGTAPLTVDFTATPNGGTEIYTSYLWSFGDGIQATGQNPNYTYTYTHAGTFNATVTVIDSASHSATANVTVTVTAQQIPLKVSAVATVTGPLTAAFTATPNGGTGDYVSYSWNFGDGHTSTSQNTTHSYANAGTYNATITVTDSALNTVTSSVLVTVTAQGTPLSIVLLTQTQTSGVVPLSVSFSVTVEGGTAPYNYSWDFGDGTGNTLTSWDPNHTYELSGKYYATVTVRDSASNVTSATSEQITVVNQSNTFVPSFNTTACPNAVANQSYSCTVYATGINTVYSLQNAPSSMSINSASGVITWSPTDSDVGTVTFIVVATNPANGLYADQFFTINVASESETTTTNTNKYDLVVDSISFDPQDAQSGQSLIAYLNLYNQGTYSLNDVIITATISELGFQQQSDQFNIGSGDTSSQTMQLDLPANINPGYYMIDFTIKDSNNHVDVETYREIMINGAQSVISSSTQSAESSYNAANSAQNNQSNLIAEASLTGYQPPVQSIPQADWTGIWAVVIIFLVLLGLVIFIARKILKENQDQANKVNITSLDNEMI